LRLQQDYPSANKGWKLGMESAVADRVPANVKQSLYLLMASVGTVMLIACANLANLTLARAAVRSREVAVRAALGAGRGRLVRQFLTESLILALGGGALGVGVAYASLAGFNRLVPKDYIPINHYVAMDARVLLFILVLAIVTGLVFGLYPALRSSRPDLRHALSQGGLGSSSGRGHQRLRQTLVVLEVGLAIVLLFGGGLLIRSFAKLKQVDTGFETDNVITGNLPINPQRFTTEDQLRDYLRKLDERLNALPGIRDAALTSQIPLQGIGMGLPFRVVGGKQEDSPQRQFCSFKTVSPSYFRLLGMRLLRGRLLDARDVKGATRVAVINETMAKRVFGQDDPIGQAFMLPHFSFLTGPTRDEIAWEVVGVVADERIGGPRSDFTRPGVYATTEQWPFPNQNLLVRTVTTPDLVQRSIPSALTEVNPEQAVSDLQSLNRIKAASIGKERLDSTLLGIFAGAALLLSALGLYGVISYSVAQRTREIGIRSALGATPGKLLWLTLRSGLALTGVGLVIGVAGAVGVGRIFSSMLFHVAQTDPLVLGSIIVLQVGVALLACLIPARRAVKVSPLVALRSE
jgi:putative ABC transport system permease protein